MGTVKRPRPQFSSSWSDRIRRLRFDDSRTISLLCMLGLAGGAWAFVHLRTPQTSRSRHAANQAPLSEFNVKIEGEIAGLGPTQLKAARIILYLPQMPFQVTRRWEQLEHPTPTSFALPLQLKVHCPASLCHLRLQLGNKVLEAGKLQIEAGASSARFPPYRVRL